jgi:serine/threonine protein kinase
MVFFCFVDLIYIRIAPEVFSEKKPRFTEKTDIWSFGVTIWELFSNGMFPYSDLRTNDEVLQFINNGKRLEISEEWPDLVKSIIKKCWEIDPSQRPSFSEIAENIQSWRKENNLPRKKNPEKGTNEISLLKSSSKPETVSLDGYIKSMNTVSSNTGGTAYNGDENDLEMQAVKGKQLETIVPKDEEQYNA